MSSQSYLSWKKIEEHKDMTLFEFNFKNALSEKLSSLLEQ